MHEKDSRAATDVAEFVTDLDGGRFEQQLSVALSQVAAAVVDHGRKGEAKLTLKFEQIKGTSQVRVEHTLAFTKPTSLGKSGEEATGATVLHVSRGGKLSLAQPSLFPNGQQSTIDLKKD